MAVSRCPVESVFFFARAPAHTRKSIIQWDIWDNGPRESRVNRELEAWMWRDPAEVAERKELQDNARVARVQDKLMQRLEKAAKQERMRALVFKTSGAK